MAVAPQKKSGTHVAEFPLPVEGPGNSYDPSSSLEEVEFFFQYANPPGPGTPTVPAPEAPQTGINSQRPSRPGATPSTRINPYKPLTPPLIPPAGFSRTIGDPPVSYSCTTTSVFSGAMPVQEKTIEILPGSGLVARDQLNNTWFGIAFNPNPSGAAQITGAANIKARVRYRVPIADANGASATPPAGDEISGGFRCVFADIFGNMFVGTSRGLLVVPVGATTFQPVILGVVINAITPCKMKKPGAETVTTLVACGDNGHLFTVNVSVTPKYWTGFRRLYTPQAGTSEAVTDHIVSAASFGDRTVLFTGKGTSLLPAVGVAGNDNFSVVSSVGPIA